MDWKHHWIVLRGKQIAAEGLLVLDTLALGQTGLGLGVNGRGNTEDWTKKDNVSTSPRLVDFAMFRYKE